MRYFLIPLFLSSISFAQNDLRVEDFNDSYISQKLDRISKQIKSLFSGQPTLTSAPNIIGLDSSGYSITTSSGINSASGVMVSTTVRTEQLQRQSGSKFIFNGCSADQYVSSIESNGRMVCGANTTGASENNTYFSSKTFTSDVLVKGDLSVKGPCADVKAYGATGDGVTDDTVAIQAALDAKHCVFFPPHTANYLVTPPLKFHDGQTIYGAGPTRSTIKSNCSNCNIFESTTPLLTINSITIRDIGIHNTDRLNANSTGISFSSVTSSVISNVWIQEVETGIATDGSTFYVDIYSPIISGVVNGIWTKAPTSGSAEVNIYGGRVNDSVKGLRLETVTNVDGMRVEIFNDGIFLSSTSTGQFRFRNMRIESDAVGSNGVHIAFGSTAKVTLDSPYILGVTNQVAGDTSRLASYTDIVNSQIGVSTVPTSALHVVGSDMKFVRNGYRMVFNPNSGGAATNADLSTDLGITLAPGLVTSVNLRTNGTSSFGTTTQSTFTATGRLQLIHRTKAQIDAITPGQEGEQVLCSDCTVPYDLCIATGTTLSGFRSTILTAILTVSRGCGTNN